MFSAGSAAMIIYQERMTATIYLYLRWGAGKAPKSAPTTDQALDVSYINIIIANPPSIIDHASHLQHVYYWALITQGFPLANLTLPVSDPLIQLAWLPSWRQEILDLLSRSFAKALRKLCRA